MPSSKQKILIVDDNPENIKVVAGTLDAPHLELAFALNGQDALDRVAKNLFDLIIMDVMMPGMDGFATVQQIREDPRYQQIPIIFLTAIDDERSIERAFSIGGSDYVCKPFRARELLVRVKYHLERKASMERLEYLASRDMLTGIYNRRKFFELAENLIQENNESIFAVIVDIDHFKSINDTYGHAVGDRVIQKVTSILAESLPEGAILGRIGGEEFAIVFRIDSLQKAVEHLEIMRNKIENLEIETDNATTLHCTISLGIANTAANHQSIEDGPGTDKPSEQRRNKSTLDELLNNADKALYEAKGAGRNRVKVRQNR